MLLLLLACTGPDDPDPVQVHETLATAVRLADQAAVTWPGDRLGHGWIQTVYAYGWHRLHAATGEPARQAYYRDWIDVEARDYEGDDPRRFLSSDGLALASIAGTLMIEDPELDYSGMLTAADSYLFEEANRLDNGAISHWAEDTFYAEDDEVWIDSLFMFGMVLLKQWERTGDPRYHDLFVEQYLAFSELCRDPGSDLYLHAWSDGLQTNIPEEPVFWARGNSWVAIAGTEYLALAGSSADPRLPPLIAAHLDATLALQEDGLWHTVMNAPHGEDPANYLEVSGSALIGFALARSYEIGARGDEVLEPLDALVDGVRSRLEEDGERLVLHDTSIGTVPGDYENYVGVPVMDDQMLGIGAVIGFLAEVDGLPR